MIHLETDKMTVTSIKEPKLHSIVNRAMKFVNLGTRNNLLRKLGLICVFERDGRYTHLTDKSEKLLPNYICDSFIRNPRLRIWVMVYWNHRGSYNYEYYSAMLKQLNEKEILLIPTQNLLYNDSTVAAKIVTAWVEISSSHQISKISKIVSEWNQ